MTGEEVRISHADFARSGAHAGFVESGESIDLARYRGRAGTSANSLEGGPEPILRFNEEEELGGDDRYKSIARLRAVGPFGVPKIRALFEATYFLGLRQAGMPDQ